MAQLPRALRGQGRHFEHLLPFADFGTGDYYCFDYEGVPSDQEPPVVHWSHETGETEPRATSFRDFVVKATAGAFEMD